MKSLLLRILIVFLLPLIISCGDSDNSTNEITYRLIDEGDSSYSQSGNPINTPQLIVIKNQNDFETFWNYHTSSLPIPSINFEEEIILVLIDIIEPSSGYSIGITKIIESENRVDVNALKSNPGENCQVLTIVTQPIQIVAIQLTSKIIELHLTETTYDCN